MRSPAFLIALAVLAPLVFTGVMAAARLGISAITGVELSPDQWLRGAIIGWAVVQALVLLIVWRAWRFRSFVQARESESASRE